MMQRRFNARVEAVFKNLDSDHSGELSMEEMERTFGEETHDFWSNMDGERKVVRIVYSSINTTSYIVINMHARPKYQAMHIRPHAKYQVMRRRVIMMERFASVSGRHFSLGARSAARARSI